jgi:hypothetical protein
MRAEKAKMDANPRIQAALRQLDANAGIAPVHDVYTTSTSMVNYGKAILGAKKYDASAFTSMTAPPVR